MKRVKEAFDLTTGLFELIDTPLWDTRYDSSDMTLEFLTSYGDRLISPLVKYFISDENPLSEQDTRRIMNLIYNKYQEQWKRKYEVLDAQYNVLENYNMVETEEIDRDTLEKNIRDIIRNNTHARNQIASLVDTIERDEILNKTRSINDVNNTTKTNNSTEDRTETDTRTANNTDTDTQTFIDRKDVETRDLRSDSFEDLKSFKDATTTLEFIDRKDTTTVDGKDIIDNTTITSPVGDGEDYTKTETDIDAGVYGFNSSGPTPSNKNKNVTEVTERKGVIEQVKKDETVTRDDETTLTKTGIEKNVIDGEDKYTNDQWDEEKGSITHSKEGSEAIQKVVVVDDTTTRVTDASTTDSDIIDSTTNISETDDHTITNNESKTTENDLTETGTAEDTENLTADTTTNQNEARNLTRKGNIGVTTTAQILDGHIKFWRFNFLDEVYRDVIGMISLEVYEGGF